MSEDRREVSHVLIHPSRSATARVGPGHAEARGQGLHVQGYNQRQKYSVRLPQVRTSST